jgi:hypothetical protein
MFSGTSFSKGILVFSTAPGLLLKSEISKMNRSILRFLNKVYVLERAFTKIICFPVKRKNVIKI